MFPSKSDGMFVPESLIFRSDSNGEDLEGYAGAGLYDSITMDKTVMKKVDYGQDRCSYLSACNVLKCHHGQPDSANVHFVRHLCNRSCHAG